MRRLSLDGLELMDAIARAGSFSAAAERLHKATSTISYAVGKLERDLGVTLFERRGPRVEVTAAGRALLDEGRLLLEAADELACRVQRVASGWESELRIALDTAVLPSMLEASVAAFCAAGHPTRLRLMSETLSGTWEALLDRRADLVLAVGDGPSGGGWRAREVGRMDFVFCVAPMHELASASRALSDAQIQRHQAIVVADSARRLPARTVGVQRGQATIAVADMRTKFAFQVAGLGVGFLPAACAAPALAQGLLVAKAVRTPKPEERVVLAWRSGDEGPALEWWLARLAEPGLVQRMLDRTGEAWMSAR